MWPYTLVPSEQGCLATKITLNVFLVFVKKKSNCVVAENFKNAYKYFFPLPIHKLLTNATKHFMS